MCCGGRGRLDAGWRWLGAHRCKDGRAAARRNLDRSMGGEQRQCRWPAGALWSALEVAPWLVVITPTCPCTPRVRYDIQQHLIEFPKLLADYLLSNS